MLKRSAEIVHDVLSDFLQITLTDTLAKTPKLMVLRFPISPRTGLLEENCFTCYREPSLAIQYITTELFWLYHFRLEYRNWKEHLDEYDSFCSTKL